jgi:SulP family sulfate permease
MTHKTAWHWLRTQYFSHLRGDLAGGLASAMTSLPGNIIRGTIAFAPLGEAYAGAGVLAGLYGTVFAGLVTAVCGSTPGIISGSYAASVAVFSAVVGQLWATGAWNQEPITGPAAVLTLAFLMVLLSGVVQVAFGVLRFGNLIRYISYPVVAGIVNGTAILFLKGAFWGYLGMPPQPLTALFGQLGHIQPLIPVIALISTLLWLKGEQYLRPVPGAVLCLVGGTALYHGLQALGFGGSIGGTLLPVAMEVPSPTSLVGVVDTLSTTAWQSRSLILSGSLTIATLGAIQSLLTVLALQNLTNVRGNGNSELIGQGLGNMVNALFGGIPAAGTAVRSMTNYKAGGRSRLSGVSFSLITLLVALLGAEFIRFIPKAVIAGMTAVIAMTVADKWSLQFIKRSFMKDASRRRELLLDLSIMVVVTGCVVFFGIMTALAVGIAISVFLFLTQMSKSIIRNSYSGAKIRSKRQRSVDTMEVLRAYGDQVAIIELDGPVFFGSTDALAQAIDVLVARGSKYIVLDLKRIKGVDVSGARALVQTYMQMRRQDVTMIFSYLYPGTEFRSYLDDLGLLESVAAEHIFVDTDQALEYCEDLLLSRLNTNHDRDETMLL